MAGLVAFGVAVSGAGLLSGVGTQQVMDGIPAREMLGDQMGAGELGQQGAGAGLARACQAGDGGDADIGAGMQAQQPEQAGRVSG